MHLVGFIIRIKILNCSTLISVGSCYLLCKLAIYVFTVSNTDPNTDGYSEHIYCQHTQ